MKINLPSRIKIAADEFAARIKPVIKKLNSGGIKTVGAIAAELNNQDIPAFRPWANGILPMYIIF
jgi:hypothetical protein